MMGALELLGRLRGHKWYTDSHTAHLFLHLLLASANGFVLTTLSELRTATGISERRLRTSLSRLQAAGFIELLATNKNTSISICGYESERDEPEMPKKNNGVAEVEPSDEGIDFHRFVEFFNSELVLAKSVIPRVRTIGRQRERHIRARVREHGKKALFDMVKNAAWSDFLNGRNDRGWTATLSWLVLPDNFLKVIEGNYNNHKNGTNRSNLAADERKNEAASVIQRLLSEK